MKPICDIEECLLDSPEYRAILESNESEIEILEVKLEKIVKVFSQVSDVGKTFISSQSAFLTALMDLSKFLNVNPKISQFISSLANAYSEMLSLETTFLEQTTKICTKLNHFIKTDVKHVKDSKQHFEKISADYDCALIKHCQSSRSRSSEYLDTDNVLVATRNCFQHTSLDHMAIVSFLQVNKWHDIMNMLIAFCKAHLNFFCKGCAVWNEISSPMSDLENNTLVQMRSESTNLQRKLEDRHHFVSQYDVQVRHRKPELIAGYLFKKASNAFKSWNRRWFALHDNKLVYKKRSGNEVTVLEEDLRLCTVRQCSETERRFCFEIVSPSKCHWLQADSESTYNVWVSALQDAIGNALCQNISTENVCKAHDDISQDFIRNIPGNEFCCDCDAQNPEWASINIGITLCIGNHALDKRLAKVSFKECSGIHRSLGVHMSKVRSLLLDSWEPETRKVFAELGNKLINSIYEAKLSRHNPIRISSGSERIERETFIRAKYVDRKFIPDDIIFEKMNFFPDSWRIKCKRRYPKKNNGLIEQTQSNSNTWVFGCNDVSPPASESDYTSTDLDEDSVTDEQTIQSLNPNTLLYYACRAHNLPIMSRAFAFGADKNWANGDDGLLTPLHQSILSRSVTACQYLLLNGCRYNIVDALGRSPLLLATSLGLVQHVCLLLKYRANQHLPDMQQRTPLSIAVQKADANIVTLLRLAQLDDHMREEDEISMGDGTFQEVMRDFVERSQLGANNLRTLDNKELYE